MIDVNTLQIDINKAFDEVIDNCEETFIYRGNGRNVIIVSEAEYRSLSETAYLLSTEANRKSLAESMAQADNGDMVELNLDTMTFKEPK